MAVSYIAQSANSYANAVASITSLNTGAPACQDDDILLCVMATRGNVTPDTPTGWTQKTSSPIGVNSGALTFFWRRVSGAEGTTTWTWPSGVLFAEIWVGVFRGCDTSGDPVDVSSTAASLTASAVVTTRDGDVLVTAYATAGNVGGAFASPPTWYDPPAGMTERYDDAVPASNNGSYDMVALEVNTLGLGAAGSTGGQTATKNGETSTSNRSFQIALLAAPITFVRKSVLAGGARQRARRASRW